MKINLSIEIEVDDSVLQRNDAPAADVSRMIDMVRLHLNMATRNFYGKIVRFDVEKDLDTTP